MGAIIVRVPKYRRWRDDVNLAVWSLWERRSWLRCVAARLPLLDAAVRWVRLRPARVRRVAGPLHWRGVILGMGSCM